MSKTAKLLSQKLVGYGWPGSLRYSESWDGPGKFVHLEDEIDRALEGKIISKSEVDALRKDAENMQSAQDAYNYTESVNSDLRREIYLKDCAYQSVVAELNGAKSENIKLKQENTNLKIDNVSMKSFSPVYWLKDTNWSEYNVKFTTTPAPNSESVAEVIPWWKFWTPNW